MRRRGGTLGALARPFVPRLAAVVAAPIAALAAALAPASAPAQDIAFKPRAQWEARADGIFGSSTAGEFGVGANVPADFYVRVGAALAVGAVHREAGTVAGARIDLVARYLLDPVREMRWGPYAGTGLTAAWDATAHWRTYLVALLGVEGPARGAWSTALELGLGGGVRAGIVLRRARSNGR